MRDGFERRGLQLVGGKPGDSAQRVVDLQPAAVHVHESHADRRIAERGLEELAHLPEAALQIQARLLCTLARDNCSLELDVERSESLCFLFRGASRSTGISHSAPEAVRLGGAGIIARVPVSSGGSRRGNVGVRVGRTPTRGRGKPVRPWQNTASRRGQDQNAGLFVPHQSRNRDGSRPFALARIAQIFLRPRLGPILAFC